MPMADKYRILFGTRYAGTELEAVMVYPETGGFALGTFDVSQRGGVYLETLRGSHHLTVDEVRELAREHDVPRYQNITGENWRETIGIRA